MSKAAEEARKKLAAARTGKPSLTDKLAKVKPASPSMVPPSPKKKEKEYVPDVRELEFTPQQNKDLLKLVGECSAINLEVARLLKRKKVVSEDIKTVLVDRGETKFVCDGIPVTYYSSQRSSINRNLLLDHGILPSVIDECTKNTESWNLKVGKDDE